MPKLLKTDLYASEPKYNSKTELGIKRNNSFIALQGKEGCSSLGPSKKPCKPPWVKGLRCFIRKYRI